MKRPVWASRPASRVARQDRRGQRAELLCRACFLFFGVLLISIPAEARRRQMPWANVTDIHGEVAVNIGHDKDVRETTGQPSLDQDELLLQEELTVGGSGWIYHPALLNVDATLGLIFNQDFLSNKQGRSTQASVNQFNYDVNLGILPYKPYPVSLFASQLRSQINSPFTPRRFVDTFRYGAGLTMQQLALDDWKLPARVLYRHQETETSSFAGEIDSLRIRDEAEFVMDNETDRTRNRFRYNWKDLLSQSRGAKSSSSRHDIRFFQERDLDRGDLSSQFFLVKSGGSLDTLSLSLNENLSQLHSRSFASSYGYTLNYQDTEGLSQISHSGIMGLSHQLYESLSSSARLNATYSDSNAGTTWTAGGGGQLNYKKKIPGGSFGLRFSPNYLYTVEDFEPGISAVVDERYTVQVGPDILLDHFLILEETIKVTDPQTLITFQVGSDCLSAGADYVVVPLGVNTAIQVCSGGELDPTVPPLTAVMAVSYLRRVESARTFSSLMLVSGFSLDLWDHFSGDVSYAKTDQTLIEGISEQSTLDNSRRLLGRIHVNFDHSRTRFEYERFESSINPRERYSITQDFNFRPGRRTTLGFGAGYDWDRVLDPDRLTQAFSASANLTSVLPFAILVRLNLLFRWIDQVEQRSLGAGPTLSLTYRYGRLRFQLTDQLTWRQTEAKFGSNRETKEVVNSVFFRIERPF